MALLTLFHDFAADLASGVHDLSSDTLHVALSNVAPVQATGSVIGDITQIAATGGYTTGGQALDSAAFAETSAGSGVFQLTSDPEIFTASGAAIPTFRYAVLYNNSAAGDELIGYLDHGSAADVADGGTFTIGSGTVVWVEISV